MISIEEYKNRRQSLANQALKGALIVIPSAEQVTRNGDSHYRFRQNSNFYYLTGFNEANACLIIDGKRSLLFNQPRDLKAETWTGKRLGQKHAIDALGIDQAYPIEQLEQKLAFLLKNKHFLYLPEKQYSSQQLWLKEKISQMKLEEDFLIKNVDSLVNEMRLIKSPAEIELMRRVADMSVNAHLEVLATARHLNYEYQLEGVFLAKLYHQGCRNLAYDSIVAGGANACVLHYQQNDKALDKQSLVLMDAAGEYQNYAADITRTFPIGGKFTSYQKAIYQLVLKAQKAAIGLIKPGILFSDIQKIVVEILTQGLIDLRLLTGNLQDLIAQEAYKKFYMHNSGHWLGLDVHDSSSYKVNDKSRPLEAGMILTVEPGIYVSEDLKINQNWWNIGVRIEDDILVTEHGYDNLTQKLPVELEDIEVLVSGC